MYVHITVPTIMMPALMGLAVKQRILWLKAESLAVPVGGAHVFKR